MRNMPAPILWRSETGVGAVHPCGWHSERSVRQGEDQCAGKTAEYAWAMKLP